MIERVIAGIAGIVRGDLAVADACRIGIGDLALQIDLDIPCRIACGVGAAIGDRSTANKLGRLRRTVTATSCQRAVMFASARLTNYLVMGSLMKGPERDPAPAPFTDHKRD